MKAKRWRGGGSDTFSKRCSTAVGDVVGRDGKPKARGGKRKGAGRKPKGNRAGAPHKPRPELKRGQPVHAVLRVVKAIGSLRKAHMYKALREATISVAKRELHDLRDGAFRIIHISIQRTHVHLIVEADNKTALSRGMQSFQISAAKHLNRAVTIQRMKRVRNGLPLTREQRRELGACRRRGTVFPDRFHQEIITNRKQARHTLAYVLKNASHCTLSGRRVEFPTCWAQTRLLQRAQRAVGYRRPRFEDFIWDRPPLPWPGQIDFKVRYGTGVPEQLQS